MSINITLEDHTQSNFKNFAFDVGKISLGRDIDCLLRLDHPSVSRHHATLSFKDGKWHICDHDTKAKTILNGRQLNPNEEKFLPSPSNISIADFNLKIAYDGSLPNNEETVLYAKDMLLKDDTLKDDDKEYWLTDKNNTKKYEINKKKQINIIGKKKGCDIIIENDKISDEHASIIFDINGVYIISVLHSKIKVNNNELEKDEILNDKDIISLNGFELTFNITNKKSKDNCQKAILNNDDRQSKATKSDINKKEKVVFFIFITSLISIALIYFKVV